MNVSVILEHRFDGTPDGRIWTQTMFDYSFWTAYLEVFDQVQVVARVRQVAKPRPDWLHADGKGVSFAAVPDYQGPWEYLLRAIKVKQAVRQAIKPPNAVILHLSSTLANCIVPYLRRLRYPYGAEVVGDPYDVFSPGAIKHPLRPFFRWHFTRLLKRQCAEASAVTYVTEEALQRRYPSGPGAFSTFYSFNVLEDGDFVAEPRAAAFFQLPLTLITVGSLAHLYKAPDILIEAVASCINKGVDLQLVLIGDGQYRPSLEARVAELGLAPRIKFLGQVTYGDQYRVQLDQADLFMLPSRQEGLPRAMIEAMARALPCIGSTVGGIPELLPPEDLVPSNDVAALADKICEVARDPDRLQRMSARNLKKAGNYRQEILKERRLAFFHYVRAKTEEWLRAHKEI
jgi:glycosyltransferase involved in cell wall biosynthesis